MTNPQDLSTATGGSFTPIRLLLFLMCLAMFVACHPRHYHLQKAPLPGSLSEADDALSLEFPVLEHLQSEREVLLKYSKPTPRVMQPDSVHHQGIFSYGSIDLLFDEVDGEPGRLYGYHDAFPELKLSFVIFGIPDRQLEKLIPGQTCRVHWVETVSYPKEFGDDRSRDFLTYKVERP